MWDQRCKLPPPREGGGSSFIRFRQGLASVRPYTVHKLGNLCSVVDSLHCAHLFDISKTLTSFSRALIDDRHAPKISIQGQLMVRGYIINAVRSVSKCNRSLLVCDNAA
jgi:hypothetical protein